MNKTHAKDFESFEHDMEGLVEKPQIVELARMRYNAKETCTKLAISPETFRRWWDADAKFRAAVYDTLIAVYMESPYD